MLRTLVIASPFFSIKRKTKHSNTIITKDSCKLRVDAGGED